MKHENRRSRWLFSFVLPGKRYRIIRQISLAVFPGAAGGQNQDREDLQASGQHIDNQNQLGEDTVAAEVAGGTDRLQPGTDVVEAGQHSGQICYKRLVVNRYKQYTQNNQNKICGEINACAVDLFFSSTGVPSTCTPELFSGEVSCECFCVNF